MTDDLEPLVRAVRCSHRTLLAWATLPIAVGMGCITVALAIDAEPHGNDVAVAVLGALFLVPGLWFARRQWRKARAPEQVPWLASLLHQPESVTCTGIEYRDRKRADLVFEMRTGEHHRVSLDATTAARLRTTIRTRQ